MRTAIWSALLAALPALCVGASAPQQSGDPSPQLQQQALPKSETGDPAKMAGQPAPAAVPGVDNSLYLLGSDDQVLIRVWGDDRLSGPYLVRPDGRISMPLMGEILASGKTPEALGKDIENGLKAKEILMHPSVAVQVTSVQSRKYRINGEVLKPGAFPLTNPIRVRDALVEAGGFKDFANKKDIRILRGEKILHFNWNDMVKGKHPEQNVLLEPGDLIIVR